jgi:murein DD-endopeptidase MepM/ murein hydrolase activator NlpD
VQPGDTLWDIASSFDVSVSEILTINNLTDANQIYVGDRLIIPGLEGLTGILTTVAVPFGETLRSLSRLYGVDEFLLRELNHIVSPTELFIGSNLVILQQEDETSWSARSDLKLGETVIELAVQEGINPWSIVSINDLQGTYAGIPGDTLYLPYGSTTTTPTGMPPIFTYAEVEPLPIKQGGTVQICLQISQPAVLGGSLNNQDLHFFQEDDSTWIALQGVHALVEPGLYSLKIEASPSDGSVQSFEQLVLIVSGYYPEDPILYVEPGTIDPVVTEPELQLILSHVLQTSPQQYWSGDFISPAIQYAESTYFTSRFGNRRTYIGSGTDLEIESFHTGLDFGGGTGLPITAPANGVVVFTDSLFVRGQATVIDHGWGVYSGFWHQSEIHVQVGDNVEKGQIIGLVGGTGRVTGAHLHWELWVNGIQVDPLDWLEEAFPRE